MALKSAVAQHSFSQKKGSSCGGTGLSVGRVKRGLQSSILAGEQGAKVTVLSSSGWEDGMSVGGIGLSTAIGWETSLSEESPVRLSSRRNCLQRGQERSWATWPAAGSLVKRQLMQEGGAVAEHAHMVFNSGAPLGMVFGKVGAAAEQADNHGFGEPAVLCGVTKSVAMVTLSS